MKESYREGIANHSGPEPCEGGGTAALEALDRGICRLGIELRKGCSGTAMMSDRSEGHAAAGEPREPADGPAESKTPGMQRNFMRENRETLLPPVAVGRAGGRTR